MPRKSLIPIYGTPSFNTTHTVNFHQETFKIFDRPYSPMRLKNRVERASWSVIVPDPDPEKQRIDATPRKEMRHLQQTYVKRPEPKTQKKIIRSSSEGMWKSLTWENSIKK